MKAMILAAGLGTRMRPLTLHTPKPLLKINDVPLIEYHITRLVRAGIRDIVINHAWLGDQIEACLGTGERFGASIQYSAESEPLETAGGIRKALELLIKDGEDRFLVINGDIFTNYPFEKLLQGKNSGCHLVLVNNPEHNPEGDFCLRQSRVVSADGVKYTFSGISVLSADMFTELKADQPEPLAPLLRNAIANETVSGELFDGYWLDVGTPERLQEIDQLVRERQIDGL
ncbi:MAG: nucleotidyltransferase family protein [Neptuniibacter sp.]